VPAYEADDGPIDPEVLERFRAMVAAEYLHEDETVVKEESFPEQSIFEKHPYLNQPFSHFKNLQPMVYKPEPVVEEAVPEIEEVEIEVADVERPGDYITPPEDTQPTKIPETLKRVKVIQPSAPDAMNVRRTVQADNVLPNDIKSSFGTKFPDDANKGDMFLRVDYLPNQLFKYNGDKWIKVDKTKTDSYTYDEQYIQYLIEKLESGEYDLDQLSVTEQELVAEKLQQQNDNT
jgi:hypothetical protein